MALIQKERPELVINAAGLTGKPSVDACESQKAECLEANVQLPAVLHRACRDTGVPFAHISSGCIFSGRREDGEGFREDDVPNFSFRQNNCSFYSGSKALGEEALGYGAVRQADGSLKWQTESPDCWIWRLRMPFSEEREPRNYLSKVLSYERLLDVENSLVHFRDFVGAGLQLFERGAEFGIYNLVNPGAVTTRRVIELAKLEGAATSEQEYRFFRSEAEFMESAPLVPRSSCVLSAEKTEAAGVELRPLETALREALAERVGRTPVKRQYV